MRTRAMLAAAAVLMTGLAGCRQAGDDTATKAEPEAFTSAPPQAAPMTPAPPPPTTAAMATAPEGMDATDPGALTGTVERSGGAQATSGVEDTPIDQTGTVERKGSEPHTGTTER